MTFKIFLQKVEKKLKWEWGNRASLLFRINRKVHRWFITHSKNPNPGSAPYISGDTFRTIAKHVFDENRNIVPEEVSGGDFLFVKIYFIEEFFETVHPQIKNPYVLITHNGDTTVDDKLAQNVDEKNIRWYAQNVNIDHPKITPIPIGLENLDYYNHGVISRVIKIQRKNILKKNKILFGFEIGTNPTERVPALDALLETTSAEKIKGRLTAKKYLRKLAQYKFVASPPGNGIDCHRTWEAMYTKTVPIVKDSLLMRHFYDLGLPLFIVKNWDELKQLDENKLAEIYHQLAPRFSNLALYFSYWQDIIMTTK